MNLDNNDRQNIEKLRQQLSNNYGFNPIRGDDGLTWLVHFYDHMKKKNYDNLEDFYDEAIHQFTGNHLRDYHVPPERVEGFFESHPQRTVHLDWRALKEENLVGFRIKGPIMFEVTKSRNSKISFQEEQQGIKSLYETDGEVEEGSIQQELQDLSESVEKGKDNRRSKKVSVSGSNRMLFLEVTNGREEGLYIFEYISTPVIKGNVKEKLVMRNVRVSFGGTLIMTPETCKPLETISEDNDDNAD